MSNGPLVNYTKISPKCPIVRVNPEVNAGWISLDYAERA